MNKVPKINALAALRQ